LSHNRVMFIVGSVVLSALLALYLFFLVPWKKYGKRQPPIIGQFWPLVLGAAKEFNIDPLKLIKKAREEYGDVYTLNIAGKLFTFIHNPQDFDLFFIAYKAKQNALHTNDTREVISFDQGVREFVARVFGVPDSEFVANHSVLLNTVRSHLSPASELPTFTRNMYSCISENLNREWGEEGTCDLFDKVVETLFWSSVIPLFGTIFKSSDSFPSFKELDKHFEMAASGVVPHILLGKFSPSKNFLLSLIHNNNNNDTTGDDVTLYNRVLQELAKCQVTDPKNHPHFGLALLWASQANSLPSTFWTIVNILRNENILQKVRSEVDAVSCIYDQSKSLPENMDQFPYLKQCVLEAIRIQSPGMIVRRVMRPMKLRSNKDIIIPAGHTLAISPYLVHHDPNLFENPQDFIPERWEGKRTDSYFVGFGKGPHECPGKAFTLVEMVLFLAILFKRYPTLTIDDKNPKPDLKRMIGVAHPITKVTLHYSTRK
jgi:hypothetical protein